MTQPEGDTDEVTKLLAKSRKILQRIEALLKKTSRTLIPTLQGLTNNVP